MVFYDINQLPLFNNPVITIGSFDGVHQGHKKILEEVIRVAKERGGESVLITFYPHPRKILQPDYPLGLLTSLDDKLELITEFGIDHIVVVPFTRDFSNLSAEAYVRDFLIEKIHPSAIVIGYDHQFGHSREGDFQLLKQICGEFKDINNKPIYLEEIAAHLVEDAIVSSTKIRKALLTGQIDVASYMLGRHYSFTGTVVKGDQLGRTLGFPTANLQLEYGDLLMPALGIYAVEVQYKSQKYIGAMSIGVRPTVNNDNKVSVEVYILNFNEDIYGQTLRIVLHHYIRPEEKFATLDDLQKQMHADVAKVKSLMKTA